MDHHVAFLLNADFRNPEPGNPAVKRLSQQGWVVTTTSLGNGINADTKHIIWVDESYAGDLFAHPTGLG